jgi:hypothetical protein
MNEWTPAVHLAKNRKSRINIFEFIYQIHSLGSQLRHNKQQSL